MRKLELADLPELAKLHAEVEAEVPPGFLLTKSDEELRGFLDGTRGVAFGIGARGALRAAGILRVPSEAYPNGGPAFPLVPEEDWPGHACFLQNTVVRAQSRGLGLQRALLERRFEHARDAEMRWVCAGVRLENTASWRNLLACGMAIAGIRFDLGGPTLGVLGSFDPLALDTDARDLVHVAAGDAAGHQSVLQSRYLGVRLEPDGAVLYQRLR